MSVGEARETSRQPLSGVHNFLDSLWPGGQLKDWMSKFYKELVQDLVPYICALAHSCSVIDGADCSPDRPLLLHPL